MARCAGRQRPAQERWLPWVDPDQRRPTVRHRDCKPASTKRALAHARCSRIGPPAHALGRQATTRARPWGSPAVAGPTLDVPRRLALLAAQGGFELVGEAADGEAALAHVAQ